VEHMLTFGDYLTVVRRRFLWIGGAIATALLVALAYSAYQSPKYEARSAVVLGNVSPPEFLGGSSSSSASTIERLVATQASVASSSELADKTLQITGLDGTLSTDQFLDMSSVSPGQNANTLSFTVRAGSERQAWRLSSAYALEYVKHHVAELEATKDALVDKIATLSDGAELARAKSNLADLEAYQKAQEAQTYVSKRATQATQTQPDLQRNLLLGLALGIAVGIGFAFLIHGADDRVYSVRRFAEASGLPVLAKLPLLRWRHRRRPIAQAESRLKEQARVAAARLRFARNASGASTLLVTSPDLVTGSSDVSTWLAWGQAEIGNRVTLIDLDFTHGNDAKHLLGLPDGRPGVSDVVAGDSRFEQAATEVHMPGGGVLTVIGSGGVPADEISLTTAPGLHLLLERAREESDVVLVNAPAVTESSFAVVVTEFADALVVVARLPRTREVDIGRLRDALAGTPTPTLGVVVVGGDDYPDAASVPPMAPSDRASRAEPRSDVGDWAADVVSRS